MFFWTFLISPVCVCVCVCVCVFFLSLLPAWRGMTSIISRRILWGDEGKLIAVKRSQLPGKLSRKVVFPGRPGPKGHSTHVVKWNTTWTKLYRALHCTHVGNSPWGHCWVFWLSIQLTLPAPF